jgi:hypothetical protein
VLRLGLNLTLKGDEVNRKIDNVLQRTSTDLLRWNAKWAASPETILTIYLYGLVTIYSTQIMNATLSWIMAPLLVVTLSAHFYSYITVKCADT